MEQTLSGRSAVVTGGGYNIGRAVALRLAAQGARVTVFGRRQALLDETVAQVEACGGDALAVAGDVTVYADCERAVAMATERFGAVDALAAIAGGSGAEAPVDEVDPTAWARVVEVNLTGTFHAIRAALPQMKARGSGAIVTTCGGGSWFPVVGAHATAYAAAKAGVCRLTDQLAVELMAHGVRVNCLEPGQVWGQDKLRQVGDEERRTGVQDPGRASNHPPEDAAELAAFLLSDASAPLTGRIASVDEDWWRDPAQLQAVSQSLHAYCLRRVDGPT
jgi:NAD(P)-dependent dehydrogenase (short-subunit alcohol dehydrogenase family)